MKIMDMRKIVTIFVGAALFLAGCTNPEPFDDNGVDLYEKPECNVMGKVMCDGAGVSGVAVSDGVSVTKTDHAGRYWLKGVYVAHEPEIFISIPSGYEPTERKGITSAFYHRAKNVEGVQTFDFELKKVDQTNYEILVMADSHVLRGGSIYGSTEDEKLYKELFLPKFKSYAQQCIAEGRRVYGIHCGDMTQYAYWNKYGLDDYSADTTMEEFPTFSAIGNHDHNHANNFGLKEFDQNTQYLARKTFRDEVGPAYYSINLGSEHYIFIDNIFVNHHETSYETRIDPLQLSWLSKDVAAVDKTKIKGMVLVMHAPIYNLNKTMALGDSGNKVLDILRNYPVTILIGHSHIDRTLTSTTSAGHPIVEYLHPTLAGTAWLGKLTTDGVPRSFVAYNFKDGKSTKRLFVPFDEGEDSAKPYRLYDNHHNKRDYPITEFTGDNYNPADDTATEASTTAKPAVVINGWGAVRCELAIPGTADNTTTTTNKSGIHEPDFAHWYWLSWESNDRNSIYNKYSKNNGHPEWQDPYRFNTHIWRFVPKDPSTPVVVKLYDSHENCTTLTMYAK